MKKRIFIFLVVFFVNILVSPIASVYSQGTYSCSPDRSLCDISGCDSGYTGECTFGAATGVRYCTSPLTATTCLEVSDSGSGGNDDIRCEVGGVEKMGINTAIGCIPYTDTTKMVSFLLKWAIGIGGGIAFILILVAGFQIMTASGDPKKIQAGKELLGSAISGLILLIFSVFILKFIGVDILELPIGT